MESKWVGKSLTVWGGLVMILPGLAQLIGLEIGNVQAIGEAGSSVIVGISEVVGFVMVVLGRVRANTGKQVTLMPK